MDDIINILAGIGAFCILASLWVIGVTIVYAERKARKQKASEAAQRIAARMRDTGEHGPMMLHPNCKMEAEKIIEDLLK